LCENFDKLKIFDFYAENTFREWKGAVYEKKKQRIIFYIDYLCRYDGFYM